MAVLIIFCYMLYLSDFKRSTFIILHHGEQPSQRKAKNWIDFSTLLRHECTDNVYLVMPESNLHLPLHVFFCAVGRKETCICCRYWQVRNHLINVLNDWGLKMSGNAYMR